ncbi:hypothetical protein ACP4OV_025623 [Aristida adscensionis]
MTGPYLLSEAHNEFVLWGCYSFGELRLADGEQQLITSCGAVCEGELDETAQDQQCDQPQDKRSGNHGCSKCNGLGCCQTPVPIGRASYVVRLTSTLGPGIDSKAFIAEEGWFDPGTTAEALSTAERTSIVPMVLAWTIISGGVLLGNTVCHRVLGNIEYCHSSYSSCTTRYHPYHDDHISGYTCKCWHGYQGNPYLPDGCQDIDECAFPNTRCYGTCTNIPGGYLCECPHGTNGDPNIRNGCSKSHPGLSIGLGVGSGAVFLLLVLFSMFLLRKIKSRRKKKLRQKYFKQNRGQLLQQLVCQRTDIAERMIITLKELEKATNNFDKARELGSGGHGMVYKGILSSLHVVAVKKSKIIVQREIDDFINE